LLNILFQNIVADHVSFLLRHSLSRQAAR